MKIWNHRPQTFASFVPFVVLPRARHARHLGLVLLALLMLAACGVRSAAQPPLLPTAAVLLATAAHPAPNATSLPTNTPLPSATPLPTQPPTPTPQSQPWRFVVLGDTRTAGLRPPEITYQIVEQAARAQPELVLAVGDMIDALGMPDEVRQQWQEWRAAVAPLGTHAAPSAPWLLVTPGNHDVQGHAWATDLLTEAFSELPANGPPGFERRTYRLDYRGVRFISIDSEDFDTPHLLEDAQLDWLAAQLRDNPSRYTIVFSHDPAYPIGPHIGSSLDAYPKARNRLWQLLREHRVSAFIAGHEHLYNRGEIEGVQQIIVGTSGSFIYGGYGGEFYHYLVGEVAPEGISITVYDQRGDERDRFVVGATSGLLQ